MRPKLACPPKQKADATTGHMLAALTVKVATETRCSVTSATGRLRCEDIVRLVASP
jgi:hypothetical protein